MTISTDQLARLPLGLQTFAKVREGNFAYVDKTPQALDLANAAGVYFLARPRRFGKSLFLDTLRNLFEGRHELFQGLYAEHEWHWSVKHPVIKLDMSGASESITAFKSIIDGDLRDIAESMGIELAANAELGAVFKQLIKRAHAKYKRKVVLLIDEYDKPMLDNIDDMELAQQMLKQLRGFYSIIKAADEHLHFVMLTGVSKFSKVSIFSGLNNLKDISLDPQYANICGYTEDDLNEVFAQHLQGVDRQQLRQWYNGYNFLGDKLVYNPHDILHFIDRSQSFGKPRFRSYWFESGTPTFIIDMIARDKLLTHQIEQLEANEELLNSSPIENIELTTLLFQSGYLTIDEVIPSNINGRDKYRLKCPNYSVRSALQDQLFNYYTAGDKTTSYQDTMESALLNAQLDVIESELKRLFAGIAGDNYRRNNIARFEGYYSSVVYSFFVGMGLKVIAEDVSNLGRIDLTIQLADNTYIVEFKVVKRNSKSNSALQQIIQQDYAAKYSGAVYQIGIEFSETRRNIVDFAWQKQNTASQQ